MQGTPLAIRQLETLEEILRLFQFNRLFRLRSLTSSAVFLEDKAIDDCLRFLDYVLFRPLPISGSASNAISNTVTNTVLCSAPGEVGSIREPAFAFFSLCYFLLSSLLSLPSADTLDRLLPASFPRHLLRLLFAPDRRERRRAKTAACHLYSHCPGSRTALLRELQFLLLDAELARSDGVQEALEFYASVLRGAAVPLQDEHMLFLRHCLLPLLKRPQLEQCFNGLDMCFRVVVEKDGALGVQVALWWAFHS